MSNNQELKSLQKTWYAKLKKSGFNDIEQSDMQLKKWSSQVFNISGDGIDHTDVKILWEAKAEYYRLAEHFLNEYEFLDTLEKQIWKLHSETNSYRDIAKKLKNTTMLKLNKDNVN